MKRLYLSLLTLLLVSNILEARHVILCGGPALRKWEDLRVERDQHDRWWANFIRASTLRMDELRRVYGQSAPIVWIVYKPGYIARGKEDGKPYTKWIQEQASKRGAKLKWVSTGQSVISTINSQPSKSITTFDFFGHSNRHCFMLDYGCNIMGASKAYIHERHLSKLSKRPFSPFAVCQSYGCHTGESMSGYWRKAVGIPLIGANGKTDYIVVGKGQLPRVVGSWTQ